MNAANIAAVADARGDEVPVRDIVCDVLFEFAFTVLGVMSFCACIFNIYELNMHFLQYGLESDHIDATVNLPELRHTAAAAAFLEVTILFSLSLVVYTVFQQCRNHIKRD